VHKDLPKHLNCSSRSCRNAYLLSKCVETQMCSIMQRAQSISNEASSFPGQGCCHWLRQLLSALINRQTHRLPALFCALINRQTHRLPALFCTLINIQSHRLSALFCALINRQTHRLPALFCVPGWGTSTRRTFNSKNCFLTSHLSCVIVHNRSGWFRHNK